MELILWRHAEATSGYPDSERRLTARGRNAARSMAAWLGPRLPAGYRVRVSPATRTQETAQALASAYETDERLGSAATPEQLLATLGWPYGEEAVVVVGHQPTLGAAAALSLTGRSYGWAMPPGSLWWIVRGATADQAVLRAFLSPDLL